MDLEDGASCCTPAAAASSLVGRLESLSESLSVAAALSSAP